MKKFDRGIILSKKYDGEDYKTTVETYDKGRPCEVTLEINDNVIQLDENICHEIQMPVILNYLYTQECTLEWLYYNMNISAMWKDKRNAKDNRVGFHLKEMIYASFFASLGEIVILSCELEENYGMSLLLFVPDTLEFTNKQKNQLKKLYTAFEETEYVEICYCGLDYTKNKFGRREEVLSLVESFSNKTIK